jgi:electron transport complex protein RnfB
MNISSLVDRIEALLPQTQCTKCGFAGCRPYARALAEQTTEINRCPPGGAAGISRLADMLNRPARALDQECGEEKPRASALIDESRCIGCTLCIQACPVDAIVGAAKQMHTVLVNQCTGCELCLPACPVDCIAIIPLDELAKTGCEPAMRERNIPVSVHAKRWQRRIEQRKARLAQEREEGEQCLLREAQQSGTFIDELERRSETASKRAAVQAALERAKVRRAAGGDASCDVA